MANSKREVEEYIKENYSSYMPGEYYFSKSKYIKDELPLIELEIANIEFPYIMH